MEEIKRFYEHIFDKILKCTIDHSLKYIMMQDDFEVNGPEMGDIIKNVLKEKNVIFRKHNIKMMSPLLSNIFFKSLKVWERILKDSKFKALIISENIF